MYDGFEIDMLALGDADCLVLTQWTTQYGPFRILIDGGKASDWKTTKDFLLGRGYNTFYAALCSHPHNDHASGLIKLVKDPSFRFATAWMHDIRNHVSQDALRCASAGNSAQADGVKQVLETTKELAAAFATRGISPQEPFAGSLIAVAPNLTVLGPSLFFYRSTLSEFTKIEEVPVVPFSLGAAAAYSSAASLSLFESLLRQPLPKYPLSPSLFPPTTNTTLVPLSGLLGNSSVKENPTTQPFNNTSVILGATFNGNRFLFTADAGSDALDCVPHDWNNVLWMQVPHHGSDGNLSQKNIERFCPRNAFISACGDSSHPSRAIVSGLIKAGAQVFSTHQSSNLAYVVGNVPYRSDYGPAIPLKGTGSPEPFFAGLPLPTWKP